MSTLAQRLSDLALRISTECKALRTMVNGNMADLSSLQTTAKTSLIAAINEVKSLADQAANASSINDAATNSTEGWSSQKITDHVAAQITSLLGADVPAALNTLDELAAAIGDDANFAATITTALNNRVTTAAIGNPDTDFVAVFNAGLV